jgi:RNA polymerase sigma-70 factor (ECF subfamily)
MSVELQVSSESSSSAVHSTLLQQVRDQDPDAWQRLVQLYGPLVYQWCRSQGLQASDAADVMQDVFQSVATNIEQFRGKRRGGSFRAWLWTIARNKLRDYYRRAKREIQGLGGTSAMLQISAVPDHEPESGSDRPSDETTHSPQHQAVRLIRDEFEEQTWQAFAQVAIESRSIADVAADLGITPNAVRIAKCRVLKRLREAFGDVL